MAVVAFEDLMARTEDRAKRDPRFGIVLASLVDAPITSAGAFSRPAAQELNRQRRADALATFRDGAITVAEAQQLLGVGTPQAVHRLRSRGRLVGLQLGNRTWLPSWQFTGGRLRPDLPEILDLVRSFTTDVIAMDRVMRLDRDELGGGSIAAALDRPGQRPRALAMLADLAV